jgi:hypothetical protein
MLLSHPLANVDLPASVNRPISAGLFLLLAPDIPCDHLCSPHAWRLQTRVDYLLHYTAADQTHIAEYERLITTGIAANEAFFKAPYPARFDVYIHPNRASFDAGLRKEFHQPDYRSACWLVGVGELYSIHLLAPARWGDGACKGRYTTYADKEKTQKLITHELTYVFHGESMRGHNMDVAKDPAWLEEGLAMVVFGQLGPSEIHDVQAALRAHTIPGSLYGIVASDSILLRYSTKGSLVLYIAVSCWSHYSVSRAT